MIPVLAGILCSRPTHYLYPQAFSVCSVPPEHLALELQWLPEENVFSRFWVQFWWMPCRRIVNFEFIIDAFCAVQPSVPQGRLCSYQHSGIQKRSVDCSENRLCLVRSSSSTVNWELEKHLLRAGLFELP